MREVLPIVGSRLFSSISGEMTWYVVSVPASV